MDLMLPLDTRRPAFGNARTCSTVDIVVSPGKVVSNAPCAQPRFTASWALRRKGDRRKTRRRIRPAADPVRTFTSHVGETYVFRRSMRPPPTMMVGVMHFTERGRHDLDRGYFFTTVSIIRKTRSDRVLIFYRPPAPECPGLSAIFSLPTSTSTYWAISAMTASARSCPPRCSKAFRGS